MIKTTLLFFATALCEIIGCFLPLVVVKTKRQYLAVASGGDFTLLALFVWLLTLHPAASGVFTRLMVAFMSARR